MTSVLHALSAWIVAALLITVSAGNAGAQTSSVSFEKKTIDMIVASDAGGGTDLVGRLVAHYMEQYLPGHPKIVAKNMPSGSGKILAANSLANTAKPDGLTLMQTDSDILQANLLKREAVKYDPRNFKVIGAINRGGSIVFIRKEAVARLTDPLAEPVVVGDTNGQRSWQAMLVWGKEFLGWNLRWVKGYEGSGPMTLAIRRGEIDLFATNGINVILPLHAEGVIDYLTQEGQAQGDSFVPRESFADVPVFPNLLKKANIPDIAWKGYRSVIGSSEIDKWLALPPKTPDQVVAVYRAAFESLVKDPEFLKTAHKQISEELYISSGGDVEKAIRELLNAPDEVKEYADNLREKYNLLPK